MALSENRRGYFRDWYQRTQPRRRELQKRSHERISNDPINRLLSVAIRDYMTEDGLTARGLAKRIGCSERMVYQYTSAGSWIDPDRFRPLPKLYETLKKIKEEHNDERSSRD